ncbi:hypothetical protein DFJ63DRAFT_311886 [Scheffersomyces coipomensis]|uniref:uncharacterized protein n=1 Tax=Scheffersomyces coipomensis TaxID=1788519 RepID=UPI00315E0277
MTASTTMSNTKTVSLRDPTNTLILTKIDQALLHDPQPLVTFLAQDNNFIIELISLPKFHRILILCEDSNIATKISQLLQDSPAWNTISISYSLRDNEISILNHKSILPSTLSQFNGYGPYHIDSANSMDYLELPSELGSRRFLISPPISPHADWNDYDKVEDPPNNKSIYSPGDLSNLLWERLGGFDSTMVRKYQHEDDDDEDIEGDDNNNKGSGIGATGVSQSNTVESTTHYDISKNPEILFDDNSGTVPVIILDSIKNSGPIDPSSQLFEPTQRIPKTVMPPF